MSQLLDTLRRAREIREAQAAPAVQADRAEAVLTSLGYRPDRRIDRRRASALWLLSSALVVLFATTLQVNWPLVRPYAGAILHARELFARRSETGARSPAPGAGDVVSGFSRTGSASTSVTEAVGRPEARSLEPGAGSGGRPEARSLEPGAGSGGRPEARSLEPGAGSVSPGSRSPAPGARPRAPRAPPPRVAQPDFFPPGQAAGAPIDSGSEAEHFRLAVYYQRAGDFVKAVEEYRQVLKRNELNAEAHNNLGVLFQEKGLYSEAIEQFQRTTYIDPKYGKAHNNLGVVYLKTKRPDAAAAEFRAALAIDPNNVDARVNLGIALRDAGKNDEAIEALKRALASSPDNPEADYNLALIYEDRGELQRAIESYREFLRVASSRHAELTADVRQRLDNLTRRLK